MIVNFRFANYTELIQTLSRANRNPFEHKPEGSTVFVDGPGTKISKISVERIKATSTKLPSPSSSLIFWV
jgi:hypothetical protein